MRAATLAIGAIAALLVLGSLLVDEGEVVTLTTNGTSGGDRSTQLWIVEREGDLYLRATSPDTEWLHRVRQAPVVTLDRGDESARFRALPEPADHVREQVNLAMAEKYGFADRLYQLLADRERAVPVRLESLGPAEASAPTHPAR